MTCTATDSHGNTSVPGTFHVTVKGADAQLTDLIGDVTGVGPGGSLAAKLSAAQAALRAGDAPLACSKLNDFLSEVAAQSGKSITSAQAAQFTADGIRIKTVIGCP